MLEASQHPGMKELGPLPGDSRPVKVASAKKNPSVINKEWSESSSHPQLWGFTQLTLHDSPAHEQSSYA